MHNIKNTVLKATFGIFIGFRTVSLILRNNGTNINNKKLQPDLNVWNCQKDVPSAENLTKQS
tara:strand:- start:85 stop:270 length:186 start_codon:yes stop_codon:yes gene_type:complete